MLLTHLNILNEVTLFYKEPHTLCRNYEDTSKDVELQAILKSEIEYVIKTHYKDKITKKGEHYVWNSSVAI